MTNRQALGFLCVAALCGIAALFFSAVDSDAVQALASVGVLLGVVLGLLALVVLAKNLLTAGD